jgi:hypothetical protein
MFLVIVPVDFLGVWEMDAETPLVLEEEIGSYKIDSVGNATVGQYESHCRKPGRHD